jgi:group I intron endonuclease
MLHTIYKITNKVNGKIYIGAHSTDNPNDNYYGSGKLILRALDKYGVKGFDKEILHTFDTKEEMFAKERELVTQEFVDRHDTYNVNIGGSAPPITIHTEESRARVSERFKGKPISEEHKAKISATKKAGYHPYRGKKLTEEHKEKNRQAQTGRKHSAETRAKISASKMGKNNPNYGRDFSEEYRKKLSEAQKGRTHLEETKQKISKSAKGNQYAKGHKQTEEHKRKLAESRARTRRRKAEAKLKKKQAIQPSLLDGDE